MEPITLRFPRALLDELSNEAESYGFSNRSEYIRHLLRNRTDTGVSVAGPATAGGESVADNAQPDTDVYGRLDELEARVDALERDTHTREDEEPAPEPTSISEALHGWSHGRTDRQERINHAVAVESLEWLREQPEEVTKRKVPLKEFADGDEMNREGETLWTEVIRPSWKHCVKRGVVGQPTTLSYKWYGDL